MLTCMRYMRSRSSSPMSSLRFGLRVAAGGRPCFLSMMGPRTELPGAEARAVRDDSKPTRRGAPPKTLCQPFHLALAVEHVETRGDHDRRASERPGGRQVCEHEVAEQDHPAELGIDEGREQGGGRQPVRGDQEIMPEAAE